MKKEIKKGNRTDLDKEQFGRTFLVGHDGRISLPNARYLELEKKRYEIHYLTEDQSLVALCLSGNVSIKQYTKERNAILFLKEKLNQSKTTSSESTQEPQDH